MTICNTDSLGEQTQREFPKARVVKALNTVNCEVMINPGRVPGDHALPICGNDAEAKKEVAAKLSEWFGWKPSNIVDLGDIHVGAERVPRHFGPRHRGRIGGDAPWVG